MIVMFWDCDLIDFDDLSLRPLLFREIWFGAFGGAFVHGTFAIGFALFPYFFHVLGVGRAEV